MCLDLMTDEVSFNYAFRSGSQGRKRTLAKGKIQTAIAITKDC